MVNYMFAQHVSLPFSLAQTTDCKPTKITFSELDSQMSRNAECPIAFTGLKDLARCVYFFQSGRLQRGKQFIQLPKSGINGGPTKQYTNYWL